MDCGRQSDRDRPHVHRRGPIRPKGAQLRPSIVIFIITTMAQRSSMPSQLFGAGIAFWCPYNDPIYMRPRPFFELWLVGFPRVLFGVLLKEWPVPAPCRGDSFFTNKRTNNQFREETTSKTIGFFPLKNGILITSIGYIPYVFRFHSSLEGYLNEFFIFWTQDTGVLFFYH